MTLSTGDYEEAVAWIVEQLHDRGAEIEEAEMAIALLATMSGRDLAFVRADIETEMGSDDEDEEDDIDEDIDGEGEEDEEDFDDSDPGDDGEDEEEEDDE